MFCVICNVHNIYVKFFQTKIYYIQKLSMQELFFFFLNSENNTKNDSYD